MVIDAVDIGVHLRKSLIFSIRTCYRSAHRHPFVVGILFLIFLLYRFLPSVFGFLLSSSPVLVCTFVLLGTLLSFGHPNIPEIEEEEQREVEEEESKKTHHDISSLKAELVEGDFVVQRDESFSVETHVESKKEIEQIALDEKHLTFPTTSLGDGFITARSIDTTITSGDDGLISRRSIVLEKEPKEIHGQVFEEKRDYYSPKFIEKREFYDLEFAQNREFSEVKPLMEGVAVGFNFEEAENVETDNPTGEPQSINLGHPIIGSAQDSSSWKEIGDHDESYDSGSDGAESSSPDASMTDIIPMLDELHPLLDVEHPQAALISHDDDSDAASERSHRSSDENIDSGDEEDVENHEEDDEEEERQHGVREDEAEAVVTWTEDDEKNLMDLGNSELERNRRLESLIARRRARKSFRMMEAEKNMIDFDSTDLPFQIAPISTARRNPFDLHYDSNMGLGLPPIPGSAPSVLLPRRNPFDLPYDPHEERPNLSGGSFTEEFTTVLEKDYFKRHESFHLGASYFAQERHDTKFRPYFVPEKMASGSVGYSAFHRQMSEISDSKVSSATETESVSSLANQEDHKNIAEQESYQRELVSLVDHTPDHVIQENQYSEEVHFDQEDKRDPELGRFEGKYKENENSPGAHSSVQFTQFVTSSMELTTSDVHVNPHVVEKQHTRSSSSSSSEEKIFDVNIEEELAHLETPRGDSMEYSSTFLQPQVVESDLNSRVREGIYDRQTEEPVYDLSPSATEKNLSGMTNIAEALSAIIDRRVFTSTSSIASDMQVEVSEVGSTSASVEGNISLTDGESSLHNGSIKNEMSSGDERMWLASPEVSAVDVNESTSVELTKISEPSVSRIGFSDVNHNSDDLVTPVAPSVIEKVMSYLNSSSSSSSSDTELEEEKSHSEEASLSFKLDQVPQSASNPHIHVGVHQSDVNVKMNPMASSYSDGESSTNLPLNVSEKQPPSMETEKIIVQQPSDGECDESQEISIPSEMATKETGVIDNVDEPIVEDFTNLPQSGSEPTEMSTKETFVIANVDEPKVEDFSNLSQSASGPAYFVSEVPKNYPIQLDFDDYQDEIQSDSKLRNLDLYQETIGSHVSEEEFDEEAEGIKDIDDGLLSELDAVGDFSFEELRTSSDQVVEMPGSLTGLQVTEVASDTDTEDVSDKSSKYEASEGPNKPMELELRTDDVEVDNRSLEMKSTFKDEVLEAGSANVIDSSLNQHNDELDESVSVEPLHDEFLLKVSEDEHPEIAVSSQEPNLTETGLELPVLEARSCEDHDSTLKQLNEGEMEKSVVEPIHEESVPEETEVGVAVIESPIQDQNPTESNLELPVVEARSLEEIDSAFKKLGEQEADELVLEEPESESAVTNHGQISTGSSLELPVVEATSLEDIDSAFKQFGEQEAVETNILEAVHNEMILEETAVESAEFEVLNQDQVLTEWSSELPVVEATSLEDIDSALRQFGEQEAVETNILEAVHNKMILEETAVESAEFEVPNQDQVLTEWSSELPVVEATSLEDIDSALRQFGEQEAVETNILEAAHNKMILEETAVESAEFEVPNQDQVLTEWSSELPVVEATSLEDIDPALRQYGEREADETNVLEAVHKESILEETEVESAVYKIPNQDQTPTETSLELPVVEAASLKDIDLAFKQLGETDSKSVVHAQVHKESIIVKPEVGSSVFEAPNQDQNPTETSLELPIHEARSLEGIDSDFKQLHKGVDEDSTVLEPMHDDPISEVTEVEESIMEENLVGSTVLRNEDQNLTETSLEELSILEARYFEDIDSAFKRLREVESVKSIVLEAVHGESVPKETEVETPVILNQDKSPREIGSEQIPVLEARSVEGIDLGLKQHWEAEDESFTVLEADHGKSALEETQVGHAALPNKDLLPVDAIESTSNQLGEVEIESPIIHETFQTDSKLEETQVGHAALPNQDQVPVDAIESTTNLIGEREFESPIIHETFQADSKLDEPETQSANPREEPSKSDFDLVVPVLEERSLEVDESSILHLREGSDEEKPIHEFIDNKPLVLDSLDSSEIRSDLHVHEEKSVGDTHSPAEKLSEGKLEDLLKPSGSEDSSAENLVKDRESSEVCFEESVKQETGTGIEKSEHGHKETHGDSSFIKTTLEKKKNKKNGSDNSSSSSSSSDSD